MFIPHFLQRGVNKMRRDGGAMINEHLEEANRLFEEAMKESTNKINTFEKTFWYRQLSYSEQMISRQTILYISEYMFDYHFQTLSEWDEVALQDILLDIFPHEIVAGPNFFEKAVIVLVKFFEFLYYHEQYPQGLSLAKKTKGLSDMILVEVDSLLRHSPEENLLSLGEELGLDTSSLDDIDCLYKLAEAIQEKDARSQRIVPIKTRKI